jgi:hypothetical protein
LACSTTLGGTGTGQGFNRAVGGAGNVPVGGRITSPEFRTDDPVPARKAPGSAVRASHRFMRTAGFVSGILEGNQVDGPGRG